MKLYYSAGSCSTSCHIVLEESGLKYEAIEVDFDNANDHNVALTAKLNGMGTLPILITDDGKQLDQNISIQTYVADKAADKKLLPAVGTFERQEALNWLSFVAADLHKGVGALFSVPLFSQDAKIQDVVRGTLLDRAKTCLTYMNEKLEGKEYLMGKNFIAADAYAFVVLGWTKHLDVSLTPYKNLEAYVARVAARPAVAKVLQVEGLN